MFDRLQSPENAECRQSTYDPLAHESDVDSDVFRHSRRTVRNGRNRRHSEHASANTLGCCSSRVADAENGWKRDCNGAPLAWDDRHAVSHHGNGPWP